MLTPLLSSSLNKSSASISLVIFIVCILLSNAASAGVTIFDTVSTVNKDTKLTALTQGRFFPEGGKLVTFYVNSKKIGTTLSGGDGYAFLKYKSSSRGIKSLQAESGEHRDEGTLLITEKKDKVILIEIESTLFDSLLSFRADKESRGALTELSKNFRVIYISSLIGIAQSKKWLHDNEFPLSAVLKWEGSELIDDLKEKGIPLYAIIASPDLLSDASNIEKRFSFTETEDATEVRDWDELIDSLE